MGVMPFQVKQPGFPPEHISVGMMAYYGGRSEVRIRRSITRVLYCDFLSMYPTVCALQNLWPYVVADRIEGRDVTDDIQAFLNTVTLDDLQVPETWKRLPVLVEIQPAEDILPVRAKYDGKRFTTALNHMTSEAPVYYTLADCIASKLLASRVPKVLRAVSFHPVGVQDGLSAMNVMGDPAYRVNPDTDDFYRSLIDMRLHVKKRMRGCSGDERVRLDAEQLALKITANATSYGIFVELNVQEEEALQEVICYRANELPFTVKTKNIEQPGPFFHPLLATFITGGARLMLAIAEHLTYAEGISWAFCDTDSMAFDKPEAMDDMEFIDRVERIRGWFAPLNPYALDTQMLKIEEANYRLDKNGSITDDLEPLFCLAVSAKRYALFNYDKKGRPVIRKASAHGLGHLLSPYMEVPGISNVPAPSLRLSEIGLERWQYDLWNRIIEGACGQFPSQVRIDDLYDFDMPAVSRYAATTPTLLRWFKKYNHQKPYGEQVKPFNYMYAFQTSPRHMTGEECPKVIAPYCNDVQRAVVNCFDRETGLPVPVVRMKTYADTLRQYHLQPEAKFDNAEHLSTGITHRRHIEVTDIEYIGKEANRWEEQMHLGADPEAQIVYGVSEAEIHKLREQLRRDCARYGVREIAGAAGISPSLVSRFMKGERSATYVTLTKLRQAVQKLDSESIRADGVLAVVRMRCEQIGLRGFARQAGVDPANLGAALRGDRPMSDAMRDMVVNVTLNG